ncbi:hypothetical protein [Desulfonema magnum]|uniref:Uncharacterized protein n=1 Tax=Desulfonema magnum TaxID=45655 RepID=A0A975GT50_9BACT|nr:hypothetical protein [Desulfonema magnum]QTA92714.1 Uncharacterized protein dnm_088030 [Desulfonema magnum]
MNKLCILVGITVFSQIGWCLGNYFGMTAAYLFSVVGSMVGVYVGWRVCRDYLK